MRATPFPWKSREKSPRASTCPSSRHSIFFGKGALGVSVGRPEPEKSGNQLLSAMKILHIKDTEVFKNWLKTKGYEWPVNAISQQNILFEFFRELLEKRGEI